ncbi:hypothetical protein AnigIFM50267_005488 [Aspergillus niger]|uniref:Large ribosomal subunit protein mL50 n=1 Tax=Aspergillus welwitschiae TaxID=1341132 RepID=A0A3F3PNP3_9EURO|nr:ribosomal subunit 39S-domain-containing protein [Aspergillus welwitschiae]RDH28458.1 ribosomal subunit 39S-domain-containing protein [Aspergillus welwitschiae]GKZ70227.1 hypothetical protein AnigIFM50267_005488 [Aspergillus niger]
MRPSMRLLSLDVQGASRTLYVCSVCRNEARPRPIVARQFLRHASNTPDSLSERVRRKLWGTDNPPGLKDPYGESLLEKRFGKAKAQPEGETEVVTAEEAAPEAEADAVDQLEPGVDYEPATTWEGLERVGHLGGWKNAPRAEVDRVAAFGLKKKLRKQGPLSLAAHQAAVEICLMHALNKPLTSVCNVAEHDKAVFKMIWKTKIVPGEAGSWGSALQYHSKQAKEALVYIFEQIGGSQPEAVEQQQAAEETAEVEEFEEAAWEGEEEEVPKVPFFGYQEARDKGFLTLSLEDPETKFAFLKRFSQLSGHFFPDNIVHQISTVKQAVDYVQGQLNPKPKKLAEILENNDRLQSLPNIKVFSKRQTRLHRDDEMGRRKIIEAELRSRGLLA